ncbi:unnamed protein product [Penicillium glandicola]
MPITEEALEATILGCAINDLSHQTLRAVLKSICAKNDEARKEAESQLLVITTNTKESPDNNKQPVPRYAFCTNCEKDFDVTTNGEESCRYHPGATTQKWTSRFRQSEPSEDLYVDNDWPESVDTDEMRERYPECFIFECCEGNLEDNPDGCEFGFHREQYPDGKPSKRLRAV